MSQASHSAGALALVSNSEPAPVAVATPAPARKDVIARAFINALKRDVGLPDLATSVPATSGAVADEDAFLRDLLANNEERAAGSRIRGDLVYAAVLLGRAFEGNLEALRDLKSKASIISIATGDDELNMLVHEVCRICVFGRACKIMVNSERIIGNSPAAMIICRDEGDRPYSGTDKDVAFCLSIGVPLVGIAPVPKRDLSRDLMRAANHHLSLGSIDAEGLNLVIHAVTGAQPTRMIDPSLVRLVDRSDFAFALKPGLQGDAALAEFEAVLAKKIAFDDAGPSLEDLHGYGAAKDWGLALVADLDAFRKGEITWADIDSRGLLLSGPPGTGKTTFAAALAKSARVPMIASSVAQWNAAPYLSGTLSAIRKCFAEARRRSPCVLLIDELDGIYDRSQLRGEYVEYWSQIVNCLLEELAGNESRDGVIVIGCSNFPDRIDAAVRRSGRLDREIRIELPDTDDLVNIFRHHLGPDVLADADLTPVAVRALGRSGADVEAYCRRAKAAARRAKRTMTIDDLFAEITAQANAANRPISAETRYAVAVHEAGHAAILLGENHALNWLALSGGNGMTAYDNPATIDFERDLDRELVRLMGGLAAEAVILGERMLVSGTPDNDLARATAMALAYESQSGLGHCGLVQMPAQRLEDLIPGTPLHAAIRARLEAALAKAEAVVRAHRSAVEAIAEALARDGFLSGAAVRDIAAAHGLAAGATTDTLKQEETP